MPPLTFASGNAAFSCARRLDEGDRVPVVLLDAGADGEHRRVEDDVGRVVARLLGEQPVGAPEDRDLALGGVGLALLVERHHDDRGAVAGDRPGAPQELVLALLEADRVDDRPCPGRTSGRPR